MKKKIFIAILALSIINYKCTDCQKYQNEPDENCLQDSNDSTKIRLSQNNLNMKLADLNETDMDSIQCESYRLIIFDILHRKGRLIRIQKSDIIPELVVKHFEHLRYSDHLKLISSFKKDLAVENWNEIVGLVYKHHFWSANRFAESEPVLDGFYFIIEGRRPQARCCHKGTERTIYRTNPPDMDPMDILFDEILKIVDPKD